MLESGSSWNLVPLPTSSTKGGWEGRAESSGIRLERGTTYLVTRSCIKTFGITFGVGTSHGQHELTWLTTARTRGKPPPSPPYSILCVSPQHLHPNGFLSRDSQGGVPKLSKFGFPGLWELITPSSDLWLGWGPKQTCSSSQELSDNVLHSTCTHRDRVDSRLLVIRSQIASLTPDLSFDHNLCYRCLNGSCKAIFDKYSSRPFHRYKEHFKARCFDPCNRALNF
jgi:hypothetical protein